MALNRSIVTRGFGVAAGGGGVPPTLPTITVVNNDDGTATVTIADSEVTATNEVRVIRVDTQWTWNEWLDTGATRTGDGNIIVTLDPGVYWFQVTSVGGGSEASSLPVYAWVSDGTDPILMQIVDAVTAKIIGLNLTSVDSDQVKDLTAVDVSGLGELSANTIMVAPLDRQSVDPGGPTNADFINYSVLVAIAAPANRSHTRANRKLWLLWHERVRQALITDKLTIANGTIVYTRLIDSRPYDRDYWQRNGFVGALVFGFVAKEQRT